MKNIIKTAIIMLTSVSFLSSANSGELTVTGTAKATYNIVSGQVTQGKGLGVTNEFDLGANGELDNGWTWNYQIQMDPGNSTGSNAQTVENDDSQLTLTTSYGTAGIFISEGGLDLEDMGSQSVYGRPTDIGDPSGTTDNADIDSYSNFQLHTPAGLMPFDTVIKYGRVTDTTVTNGSGNAVGSSLTQSATTVGRTVDAYQIKATPIAGLNIGASYVEFGDNVTATDANNSQASYAAGATYALGAAKIGYSEGFFEPALTTPTTTDVESYDQQNYSLSYLVDDNLSLSYEMDKSEVAYVASATAGIEQESSAIQAAYTMGGMTLAVSHGKYENNGYVLNADGNQTLFALTMAF